jgi:hypothetical protein
MQQKATLSYIVQNKEDAIELVDFIIKNESKIGVFTERLKKEMMDS